MALVLRPGLCWIQLAARIRCALVLRSGAAGGGKPATGPGVLGVGLPDSCFWREDDALRLAASTKRELTGKVRSTLYKINCGGNGSSHVFVGTET